MLYFIYVGLGAFDKAIEEMKTQKIK